MKNLNFAIITIIGLLLMGCQGQGTNAVLSNNNLQARPGPVLAIPNSSNSSAPASSGPYVTRYQGNFYNNFLLVTDAKSGLALVIGTDPVQLCQGIVNFDLVSIMDINVPTDAQRISQLIKGTDVTTSVWNYDPNVGFACSNVLSEAPVATGTSNLVSTDNDLTVFLYDNKDHNAFGFNAHGKLTGPNGEPYAFSAFSRTVWDGINLNSVKNTHNINLHLIK